LRQYERSGLSQVEFADQHQLGLSTLRRWIAQGRSTVKSPAEALAAWQEVKLPRAVGPGRWAAEIVRPDGWILRVAPEASPTWVGELLRASAC
jgi:hypothetical protein